MSSYQMPDDQAWKILIVDDEQEVHILTRTVLKDVIFDNKALVFLSAYDSKSTRKILREESDIAIILMDVVMEEDDTGLELIRYIREELGNRLTRIILRTGAPGEAPERRIIVDYEINDYKEKVDLTTPRLFTSIIKSLRNYRDLISMGNINRELEGSRERLTRVIKSSSELYVSRTLDTFVNDLIVQAAAMLNRQGNVLLMQSATDPVFYTEGKWIEGKSAEDFLAPAVIRTLENYDESSAYLEGDFFIGRLTSFDNTALNLISDGCANVSEDEMQMMEIFFSNVNIVYNNLSLKEDSQTTQSEMIGLLGDVIENRDSELLGHVSRVSEYAIYLARKLDFPEEDIIILRDAVSMHDIGKIGIFDSILNKPGRLTPEEFEEMKKHTDIGYEILRFSSRKLFQMAAIIAREHHERWDGKGYPRGHAGEQIHRLGRISCIADVFDALSNDRAYRKAWSFEKTIQFIKNGRGTQFDPLMVDLFLEDQDCIREIKVRGMD